ncbi:MAG: stage 0 sporulation family protein [Armatimonadota bacterium]
MALAVGISFRPAGRIYSFDPNGLELRRGALVVTETARGEEIGTVKHEAREIASADPAILKRVLRLADAADREQLEANRQRAEEALALSRQRVAARQMPMKLLRAEFAFDLSQVTIYFAAEGRVDFRELVKDLAGVLRTRIQLHQVGARDAAKLLGGIGPCGRALCCSTWLTDFEPISMKMAKEQSLFLNPTKFSGVCGKLMCCLRYEYDTYRETKAQMPSLGAEVDTADGRGRVVEHNVVKETVLVGFQDGVEREYPAGDVARPLVRGCSVLQGGKCAGGCGPKASPAPAEPADEEE